MKPIGNILSSSHYPASPTGASGVFTLTQAVGLERASQWPGAMDYFYNNVAMLLRMESGTVIDASPSVKLISNTGVTIGTSFKYGGKSAYFDGTTSYLSTFMSYWFQFGTTDFTIECWVNVPAPSLERVIVETRAAATATSFYCGLSSTNYPIFYDANGVVTSSIVVPTNTWTHVAFVKAGPRLSIYVGGQLGYTGANTNTQNPVGTNVLIGKNISNASFFSGYIDELRITKGIARYTNPFTVQDQYFPVVRLPAGKVADYDPYLHSVDVLLHFEGANAGTVFTDSSISPKTITIGGGTPITSTTTFKIGTTSGYFNGSSWLNYTSTPFGTEDFTIEGWINCSVLGTGIYMMGSGIAAGAFQFGKGSGNKLTFWKSGNVQVGSGSATLTSGQWYHVAAVRSGTNLLLFLDGQIQLVGTDASNYTVAAMAIGAYDQAGTQPFNGYIDDFRVTKGIARYVSNFTPVPTAYVEKTGSFATWNPNDKNSIIALSNGNLVATSTGGAWNSQRATMGKSSGKWYWEVTQTGGTAGTVLTGIATLAANTASYCGNDAYGWSYNADDGKFYNANVLTGTAATYTLNDTIGVMWDADNGTLSFLKNNAFQGIAYTGLSGTMYPMSSEYTSRATTTNFGQRPLLYTPPNGTFWNPKDTSFAEYQFSNNNLVIYKTGAGVAYGYQRINTAKTTGKWYAEITVNTVASLSLVGVGPSTDTAASYVGQAATSVGYYNNGTKYLGGVNTAYGTAYTDGAVIGIALDMTNGKVFFSLAGTWQNSGDPVAGTGFAASGITGTQYLAVSRANSAGGNVWTLNVGATPFKYAVPSGYTAWDSSVYTPGIFETSAPVIAAVPVISGVASQNATLTASTGNWAELPIAYKYQWYQDTSTVIANAISNAYTIAAGDVGHTLYCSVASSNLIGYSTYANSASTGTVVVTLPIGQAEYLTPGTYSWTCPTGVTSVCVVCVGGGAAGGAHAGVYYNGGGGGGLGWKNNIAVTPGNSYTVVVGAGGAEQLVSSSSAGAAGGDSYFINTSTVKGGGAPQPASSGTGGTYVGDGGGNGGAGASTSSGHGAGGGGAGGYTAAGGNGNNWSGAGGTSTGGGGGGGAVNTTGDVGAGGGGTGIYGAGTNGAGGPVGSGRQLGGYGGSDGGNGGAINNGLVVTGCGGFPGGGSGSVNHVGNNSPATVQSGAGGGGAVRIIWGAGRAFPATKTYDVDPLGATTYLYWRLMATDKSWNNGRNSSYGYLQQVYSFNLYSTTNYTGTDLANTLGTATASSVFSSYVATNANDNNGSTAWVSQGSTVAPEWLKIAFGSAQAIASVNINWWSQSGGYQPKAFNIQCSNDNTTWYTVKAGTTLDDLAASQTTQLTNLQVGTRIYATWDPTSVRNMTLSNGNLTTVSTAGSTCNVRSTIGKSYGKWYWEVNVDAATTYHIIGVQSSAVATTTTDFYAATTAYSYIATGNKLNATLNPWTGAAYGATWQTVNDKIGVALDMDAGTITFYKNGATQGVAYSGLTGTFYAGTGEGSGGVAMTTNFGATAFTYAAPSGYNSGLYT